MSMYDYLHHSPAISKKAKLFPGSVVTGDVVIEDCVSVWFNAIIRGDMAQVMIKENTNIQDGAIIHTNIDKPTLIGKNCTIGHGAIIHACTIGNDVLIGMGSIILDGAVIGDGAMIGAGTIVLPKKIIPPKMLAYGNPMLVTRILTKEELDSNRQNAINYVKIMQNYTF